MKIAPARLVARSLLLAAVLGLVAGCGHAPKMPHVSLPTFGGGDKKQDEEKEKAKDKAAPAPKLDLSATPRDLISAKLVNPRAGEKTPNMTVGKLVEFADRTLACDCANMRFAHAWEKTGDGYLLMPNSSAWKPLHFVCTEAGEGRECFLAEIDRGQDTTIPDRFLPGSEFIRMTYESGVKCAREEPCE